MACTFVKRMLELPKRRQINSMAEGAISSSRQWNAKSHLPFLTLLCEPWRLEPWHFGSLFDT